MKKTQISARPRVRDRKTQPASRGTRGAPQTSSGAWGQASTCPATWRLRCRGRAETSGCCPSGTGQPGSVPPGRHSRRLAPRGQNAATAGRVSSNVSNGRWNYICRIITTLPSVTNGQTGGARTRGFATREVEFADGRLRFPPGRWVVRHNLSVSRVARLLPDMSPYTRGPVGEFSTAGPVLWGELRKKNKTKLQVFGVFKLKKHSWELDRALQTEPLTPRPLREVLSSHQRKTPRQADVLVPRESRAAGLSRRYPWFAFLKT